MIRCIDGKVILTCDRCNPHGDIKRSSGVIREDWDSAEGWGWRRQLDHDPWGHYCDKCAEFLDSDLTLFPPDHRAGGTSPRE